MNTRNLELWLGLASVAGGSVLVVDSMDGSRWIALFSVLLTSYHHLTLATSVLPN